MSRVIYHYFGCENRFRIIEFLNEKHNWDPVMMMGRSSKKFSRLLEEKYPKCILESPDGLRKSEFDYSKFGQPVPIDSDIIAELSKYELSFLNNLYGTDPWIFSFQERRTHYYHVLRYWNTVINKLKPDLLVFNGWPHTPSCHSLYLLGKYYYNIDVLFVDTVPLFNGAYHTIGCSIEDLGAIVDDIYRSNEVLKMSSNVREYLNQVRSEKGLTPKYIVQSKKKFNNNRRLLTAVMRYLGLMRRIVSGDAFSNTVDYKSSRSPYYLKKSKANQVEYMFYVEKRSLDNYRLKRVYEKYCVEPDYAKKYLYFAATYQPEAVTATNAGVYDDLFLALDILSYSIPDDWVILYKENPMIFSASPLGKGSLRRDKYYYQRLNDYRNIELVSSDIDTFRLIDSARAVATVSGTVAWEASLRGKPALSFGSAWYLGCDSIFHIRTLKDALDAMVKIVNGYSPDQVDIERYVAALEQIAVKDMVHRNFEESVKKCENPQYEMERIGEALHDAYQRYYPE